MSLYYSIGIGVQGANPERALDIKEAAEDEWPFDADDWYPCGHPDDLTAFEASATGNLCAVLTEQELAHRLIRAVWTANGGYCEVEVSATRLEDMPYETYRLDLDDFERMAGKAAEAVGVTDGNGADPNHGHNPDLPQPQQENHHG